MPLKKPCARCGKAISIDTKPGYCPDCQARRPKAETKKDPKVKRWLNSKSYKFRRAALLKQRPYCEATLAESMGLSMDEYRRQVGPWYGEQVKYKRLALNPRAKRVLADTLDHIVPHRSDHRLFWDRDNWQALSKREHDRKTRRGE